MRLVESYASGQTTEVIEGRTYPLPCLVEDTEDGIRWLLNEFVDAVPGHVWARATAAGAVAILAVGPRVGGIQQYQAMTTEKFIEVRRERAPLYEVDPENDWVFFDHVPRYTELFSAGPGTLVMASPRALSGFVHGHTHAEYSALDGLSKISEIVEQAVRHGQPAVALTDHGRVSGHPELQLACDKAGIKPVFGLEAYFQDDRFARSSPDNDKEVNHAIRYGYWHLVLWAMNDEGLHNLWAMSTESFRDGMYDKKPRLDWDTLRRHSSGVMAASGCLRGPLSVPILNDDLETAQARLGKLLDIFGDRFYLEIQPNALAEQEKVNRALVHLGKDFGVPLMATVDSHYPTKDDYNAHEAWIAVQTNSDVQDEGDLFAVNLDLWMQGEEDVRKGLAYLGADVVEEAVRNTLDLVSRTEARIGGKPTPPVFSKKGGHERDAERLLDLCLENWSKVTGKEADQSAYMERFEREFKLLQQKDFCGYFLMVSDYCRWAKSNGILVGPGRGSGGGSLVAYLCDITEIDPVEGDLPFERFMTEGRTSLPDFDCVAGTTEFHRDGPGDRTVAGLYNLLHGRPDAQPGECEVCGTPMDSAKRGYKGNPSVWLCVPCYKKRHRMRTKGLPSILGRNALGRLSNQPLIDVMYKGVRDTLRITVADGRFIESTLEHRHLTLSGWREAKDIGPGDLMVLMDDRGRRASHTDNLSADAKARLIERAGTACELCFEKAPEGESWLGKFEVAHLDYSTKNIDNMLFLCVGCHRRMDAQLGTPVVFRSVVGVEDAGEQPVYDVVMGHEDHSWVANGFVTHNCDFPASKKEDMLDYVREKYGADQVVQIGTHLRLKSKGIVKALTRAMMSVLTAREQEALDEALRTDAPADAVHRAREALQDRQKAIRADLAKVSDIVKEAERDKAGLGMAWDDLWAQFGDDLQSYRDKYPELFSMADRLQGRLMSYGKHAAGVVISTGKPLTDWLPMAQGEDEDSMVTQFDMGTLEAIGLVKFDILTIRTLDTIQMAVDLIKEHRGVDVEIYSWKEEYADPQVWEEVAAAKTLGIFQIETSAGTRLCQQMGPRSLPELCDMITLVRPGPMRSGLTETYLKRRAGLEPVSYPDPRMEQVLGPTWGCMIYQEQIMQACILLGGYTSDEADEVRKILGKKKIEKIGPAGQEFVSRAVQNGMEREAASHLWDQMAEFAKYSFGKAHAYAYAVLAYWTAWLKFHYPIEFFTAALSTIDKPRIPEFIKEVRRAGYTVLPPDINASGKGFRAESLAVRYGLDSISGIGEASVDYLVAGQPYTSFEQFDEYVNQKGTGANAAVQMTLARIGALDSLVPSRAGLVRMLEDRKSGLDTRCVFKNDEVIFSTMDLVARHRESESEEDFEKWRQAHLPPDTCTFDWDTEEAPVNPRTGKKLKKKPLPKKCTKACRQYKAPEPIPMASGEDFTAEEIRAIEHELLGVFLSSSPFERLDPEDRQRLYGDAEAMLEGTAGRLYTVAAILMGIRKTKTRASGDEMAFLTLDTETSTVEAVCFPRKWTEIGTGLSTGQLCLVVLEKQEDDKGFIVQEYLPVH